MPDEQSPAFDKQALQEFYIRISAKDGVKIADFQEQLAGLFERSRPREDLQDYRLSKGMWKKLADEIVPVSSFLQFKGVKTGRISFPLDDKTPDSWLWEDNQSHPTGIEVTIAQATERFHLATELVTKGLGRGFVGISDDAPRCEFDQAMAKERIAYSAEQVLTAVGGGIRLCLAKKNKKKYAGFILLIQAPLLSLPREQWGVLESELSSAAASLPFQNVFVISNGYERLWGFQIK